MKTNRAVPFRYDSITTKEGAPVYLFASEPNIEPAKDIMAITSQGIQTEELPIGRFGLNRREQTRLRRFLTRGFTPRRKHELYGATDPWGKEVLEATQEGAVYASEVVHLDPNSLFVWQEITLEHDAPFGRLRRDVGLDFYTPVNWNEKTTYLTAVATYDSEKATSDWRKYYGFISGFNQRIRDVTEQFRLVNPVQNPAMKFLGITDFHRGPTSEQKARAREYL